MPTRLVDGDAVWRSNKLREVQPEKFRAEFANLLPLALSNGTFECEPNRIWCDVYSYNRPSIGPQDVAAMLDEFERVKLLFRWQHTDGKTWGFWVKIDLPGRLPPPSKRPKEGAEVPTKLLREFLYEQVTATQGVLVEQYREGTETVPDGFSGLVRFGLDRLGKTKRYGHAPKNGDDRPLPGFDAFWEMYPRQLHRLEAKKKWKELSLEDHTADVLAGLLAWKESVDWHDALLEQGKKHIPHATTFLHNAYWKDSVVKYDPRTARRTDHGKPSDEERLAHNLRAAGLTKH